MCVKLQFIILFFISLVLLSFGQGLNSDAGVKVGSYGKCCNSAYLIYEGSNLMLINYRKKNLLCLKNVHAQLDISVQLLLLLQHEFGNA